MPVERYFTLVELRASDVAALSNEDKYPDATLQAALDSVEVEFERICNRAFVTRTFSETVTGDGTASVYLEKNEPSTILTVDGVAVSDADFSSDGFKLLTRLDGLLWTRNQRFLIEYEYGTPVIPSDIKDAAIHRARGKVVSGRSRIDERATMMQIPDFGTFNLATAGLKGSWTGIPDIDVVLNDYAYGRGGAY